MHAPQEAIAISNPGPAQFPSRWRSLMPVLVGLGVVVFALGLALDPRRAWYSFLVNYLFFLILGLGGVFLVALEYITSATWTVVFRRLPEAASAYLPAALLLGIALLIGVPHIYPWAVAGYTGFITHGKHVYFEMPFYSARTLVALSGWVLFGWWFVRNSTFQDTHPAVTEPRPTFGKPITIRGRMAAGFLVFFAYSFTWCFIDWVMSLYPHWYTTMWGVYGFAGLFESSLALVLLFTVLLRRRNMFGEAVRDHHYVDLARIVHAFSIFMVYIGFAQYLLIWYANFREETVFFHARLVNGWGYVFLFLLFAKWVLPFCILMNQKIRTHEPTLIFMAGLILVAEWFDCYWLVMPSIHTNFYVPNWLELGMFLGFLGIFGTLAMRYLSRHPMVPIGDPKFLNSVAGRYL
ncbi:MAG: hypothetical protein ACRD1L_00095 [Terriglobales bacterium]